MAQVNVVSIDLDTKELAEEWMKKYYGSYHPAGYGTSLSIHQRSTNKKWFVTGYRWDSCD